MRKFLRSVLDLGVLVVALPLLALILFLPPAALIRETIDLADMRERAVGKILDVSIVAGRGDTSRARVRYEFQTRGRRIVSERYVPGFLGSSGTWTGGAIVASHFHVGQAVTVYYSAGDPTHCALEYGWFWFSVSLSLVIGGGACAALARSRQSKLMHALWFFGTGSILYGFASGFLGPDVVRVRELPWHLLAWCGALGMAATYGAVRRRSGHSIEVPWVEADSKSVPEHIERELTN